MKLTTIAIHTIIGIIALLLFIAGMILVFTSYVWGIVCLILSACLLQYASWFYKANSKF